MGGSGVTKLAELLLCPRCFTYISCVILTTNLLSGLYLIYTWGNWISWLGVCICLVGKLGCKTKIQWGSSCAQNYITLNKKTLEEYIQEYLQDFKIGQGFFNRTQIALTSEGGKRWITWASLKSRTSIHLKISLEGQKGKSWIGGKYFQAKDLYPENIKYFHK